MRLNYEYVCQHCGGLYYATQIDQCILNIPLCLACIMTLDPDSLDHYKGNPFRPYLDKRQVSQANSDRTSK